MIISVSRRTDIPAFYTPWFINRLRAGFCYVQNPMNRKQIRSITLTPEVVDFFVFWTRNGTPLLSYLQDLKPYHFYFQWTLTAYGREVEPNLPPLEKRIEQFQQLAETFGSHRVVWRYDPIFLSSTYTVKWHLEQIELISTALSGFTDTMVFSFYDNYKKCDMVMQQLGYNRETAADIKELATGIYRRGQAAGMNVSTCAEAIDLSSSGIAHGACINAERIEQITGRRCSAKRDKNQRAHCLCIESVDIGIYHSCPHLCRYCYANGSEKQVWQRFKKHNPQAPLLIGTLQGDETIRKVKGPSLLSPPMCI